MPLESLLSLVEKLRERIEKHDSELRKSEALTRYALIDPLLRELGWDTGDPDLVVPEYNKLDEGRPDYALLSDGNPIMMVEAKKLDTSLQGRVIRQGISYCQDEGTPYFSVTDGRSWEIYNPHLGPIPIAEKRIAAFDLKDRSATEVCRNALVLWELRLSGRIGTWQAPGVVPTPNRSAQPESPIPNIQPTPPSPDEHEWQTISELNPQKGDTSPREVRFPDGSTHSVKAWGWLVVEVTRWLVDGNYLETSHCPILSKPKGRTHCAVAIEPVHLNGKSFTTPEAVGPLHVETGLGSRSITKAVRAIIKRVGQDPAQFKVRFSR